MADDPLVAVRAAKQYLTYVSASPFRYAIAKALRPPDTYLDGFRTDLQHKRDLLGDGLRAAGLEVYEPQGTYFITTDITLFGEKDAYVFCHALPERCDVVTIPNSVFYDDAGRSQVRFTFCKRHDVLGEATSRLQRLAS